MTSATNVIHLSAASTILSYSQYFVTQKELLTTHMLLLNASTTMLRLRPLLSRHASRTSRSCFFVNNNGSSISTTKQQHQQQHRRNIHIEKKINELGIELPAAPMPKANYNIICLPPGDDNIMYVSGHLPIKVRLCV